MPITYHSIEIPETTYQLLRTQAARLQVPIEQLIEQLVMGDLALPPIGATAERDQTRTMTDTVTALAAVERLTTLFLDVTVPDFEHHLTDPMLALANTVIEPLLP